MNTPRSLWLGLAIASALAGPAVQAQEQERRQGAYQERLGRDAESYTADGERIDQQAQQQEAPRYPEATRVEPAQTRVEALDRQRNAMIQAFQAQKFAEARTLADALAADSRANGFERATAARVAALSLANLDINDHANIVPYLEKAIAENALTNNAHFGMMLELSQRYLIQQNYQAAADSITRFLGETRSGRADAYAIQGNALYRLQRLPEAEAAMVAAVAAQPQPEPSWLQLLAKIYGETNRPADAARVTEQLVQLTSTAASGGDNRADQVNLAITYRDAGQLDRAAEVVDRLRQGDQLVEERDYLTAIGIYDKLIQEQDAERHADLIETIRRGLDRQVLRESANLLNLLAETYYFSDQIDPAIAAWNKAAPLASNGSIYLNLAVVLEQEQRDAEARAAAQTAISKGLSREETESARRLMARLQGGGR